MDLTNYYKTYKLLNNLLLNNKFITKDNKSLKALKTF
jgi:hypothetical protein